MRCLTSSRFTQKATVLHVTSSPEDATGHWEDHQDPLSGDIVRVWVADDPNVTEAGTEDFKCTARSFVSGGINGNGAIERWLSNGDYVQLDTIRINYPIGVNISLRDRVTNIRDSKGRLVFKNTDGSATIYNVDGISPVLDGFNKLMEYTALLSRAENQDAS